ncbi:hypothetical protein TNCV_1570581 [Trichonephila clavipes]|uniref:Uncharacterized protein n=1 Tax=Trichonephila clavipes TaxID=2585209 RepID=A0A8X6VEA3_TRICX|nr:hypothetical protein TNCV_1570581 [Trichonephila clavipes]
MTNRGPMYRGLPNSLSVMLGVPLSIEAFTNCDSERLEVELPLIQCSAAAVLFSSAGVASIDRAKVRRGAADPLSRVTGGVEKD